MDRVLIGDIGDEGAAEKGEKGEEKDSAEPGAVVDVGQEPPPPDFVMDFPNLSSIDLCVIGLVLNFGCKLTLTIVTP